MALMTYLSKDRHGTYYFRRVIPPALRPFMQQPWTGKANFKTSLPQRRHHVRRLAVAEGVKTPAQGFNVDGDRHKAVRGRRRRNRRCVPTKRGLQRGRSNALQDLPQPTIGRRVRQPQAERFVQPLQMNANEFMNLPIRVGSCDHADNSGEQHGGQIEPFAFSTTMVGDHAQNLQ